MKEKFWILLAMIVVMTGMWAVADWHSSIPTIHVSVSRQSVVEWIDSEGDHHPIVWAIDDEGYPVPQGMIDNEGTRLPTRYHRVWVQ